MSEEIKKPNPNIKKPNPNIKKPNTNVKKPDVKDRATDKKQEDTKPKKEGTKTKKELNKKYLAIFFAALLVPFVAVCILGLKTGLIKDNGNSYVADKSVEVTDSDLMDSEGNVVGDKSVDTTKWVEMLSNFDYKDYVGYTVTSRSSLDSDENYVRNATTYITDTGYYSEIESNGKRLSLIKDGETFYFNDDSGWRKVVLDENYTIEDILGLKLNNFLDIKDKEVLSCVYLGGGDNFVQLNIKVADGDGYKVYEIPDVGAIEIAPDDPLTYTDENGKEYTLTSDMIRYINYVIKIDTNSNKVSNIEYSYIGNNIAYSIENSGKTELPEGYTEATEIDDIEFYNMVGDLL